MVNAWVPSELPGPHRPAALPQGRRHKAGMWCTVAVGQALRKWQGLAGYTAAVGKPPYQRDGLAQLVGQRCRGGVGFLLACMPVLLLSGCGPRDCWDIRGCHSSYMEYPAYPMPAPPYTPGTAYSDIPMSSGTIMQGGRATGYYSTFGNQTTIIQPGKAPIYIDGY